MLCPPSLSLISYHLWPLAQLPRDVLLTVTPYSGYFSPTLPCPKLSLPRPIPCSPNYPHPLLS